MVCEAPEDLSHDTMTASSCAEGAEAILGRGVGESGGLVVEVQERSVLHIPHLWLLSPTPPT